jgi:SagB-type dehydrogenase family enzyme
MSRKNLIAFLAAVHYLVVEEGMMDPEKEAIGDRYHGGTRYRRESMSRTDIDWARQPPPWKEDGPGLKRFPLPAFDHLEGESLWRTLAERRSNRSFSSRPIPFSSLARLLWATQGVTGRSHGFEFRVAPSAGALYPIETYLVLNRVEGLAPGVYHYSVKETSLVLQNEGSLGPELARAGLGQEMLAEAACVFVWTAMVARSKWKYRERAYRYIYMDAGHVGQNLYLAATGLGLGCCTVGAFFDGEVDRIVGADGEWEISLYLGAVGPVD